MRTSFFKKVMIIYIYLVQESKVLHKTFKQDLKVIKSLFSKKSRKLKNLKRNAFNDLLALFR